MLVLFSHSCRCFGFLTIFSALENSFILESRSYSVKGLPGFAIKAEPGEVLTFLTPPFSQRIKLDHLNFFGSSTHEMLAENVAVVADHLQIPAQDSFWKAFST